MTKRKLIFYRIEDTDGNPMYLITEQESEGLNLDLVLGEKEAHLIRTVIMTDRKISSFRGEMLKLVENTLHGTEGMYGELYPSKIVEFTRWVDTLKVA